MYGARVSRVDPRPSTRQSMLSPERLKPPPFTWHSSLCADASAPPSGRHGPSYHSHTSPTRSKTPGHAPSQVAIDATATAPPASRSPTLHALASWLAP